MKDQKSVLLLFLAMVSLVAITAVVTASFLKNKNKEIKPAGAASVLGETSQSQPEPTSSLNVERMIENTFQTTKEVAQQKAGEVQKTVVNTIEKEIGSLTQSQVEALKLQICRDWGVVTSAPTKTP